MNTINTLNLERINERNMNRFEKFGIDDTPDKNPADDLAEIGKIYSSILRKDSVWEGGG